MNVLRIVWLSLLISACVGVDEDYGTTRLFAMGTWVDITLDSAPDAVQALQEIESMLRGYELDYYAWADGELAAANAALAAGSQITVDANLADLLQRAQQLAAASSYSFDPGVGGLVELWGFHSDLAAPKEPPEPAAVAAWLAMQPSIANLVITEDRVSGGTPMLKLDLGGIAKGNAVDKILMILQAHAIERALVNAGGDLRVLGDRRGRPWTIGIQSPRDAGIIGTLELKSGEAAFTSGDYERFYEHEDDRLHHILDPRTGYPADHTQAVTVVAGDGVLADAAATALFVAGPDRWQSVAAALGISLVLRVDASGRIEMTEQMRDRLQISRQNNLDIILGVTRDPEP